MNDDTIRRDLLIAWEYCYLHDSWVAPLSETLEGVTAEQALWRSGPDAKGIWDIVLHVALWNENIIERINTGDASYPPGHIAWPPPPASPDEAEWESAKLRLWSSLDAVKQMLETTPMSQIENSKYGLPDLLCRFVHVGYHIGQVVKIFEVRWNPEVYDWTRPPISEWTYVWNCLHDGEMTNVSYDERLESVALTVELGFPEPKFPTPKVAAIELQGLSYFGASALVRQSSRDDGKRRLEPSHPTRIETLSLPDFAKLVSESSFTILDPHISLTDGRAALMFDGLLDDHSAKFTLVGETMTVSADGTPIAFDELDNIGLEAWNAWKRGESIDE